MISWPIWHGGEAHANIRAKEEEEKQDYLAYQKTVLGAVQDSEDALVRYAAEQRRYLALGRALASRPVFNRHRDVSNIRPG